MAEMAAACTSQVSDKAAPSVPFKQNVFLTKKYVKINVNKQLLCKNWYIWYFLLSIS